MTNTQLLMKHRILCFPVNSIYARMLAVILACWWLQNIRFILLSILVQLISAAVIRWWVRLRLVVELEEKSLDHRSVGIRMDANLHQTWNFQILQKEEFLKSTKATCQGIQVIHHPSILVCLSGVRSLWQSAKRGIPGIPVSLNTFQLLLGDSKTFLYEWYNPYSKFWVYPGVYNPVGHKNYKGRHLGSILIWCLTRLLLTWWSTGPTPR